MIGIIGGLILGIILGYEFGWYDRCVNKPHKLRLNSVRGK